MCGVTLTALTVQGGVSRAIHILEETVSPLFFSSADHASSENIVFYCLTMVMSCVYPTYLNVNLRVVAERCGCVCQLL